MNSNWRWTAIITFILFALAAVYFRDVLTGKYLLVERDLGNIFIPTRFFWVDMVKNGSFPFWNPYHLNGHPLFATVHPGVFYPLSIIYFFLPFDLSFNYTIVFHFFLAGLFNFLLLRYLNASYSASLISAITFMFSGYLLSSHCYLNLLFSVPWVPLVFLLFISGLRKRSIRLIVFAGLATCPMFLGGGVEIVYVTIAVVCLLLFLIPAPQILECINRVNANMQRPPEADSRTPYLIKLRFFYFGIFIAVFLGVSAVQILPLMELITHSSRAQGHSYAVSTTWSMPPKELLLFFLPDKILNLDNFREEQNLFKTIYLGTIPFFLTLFFFLKRDKRVLCAFLLVIAGSLILAFGKYTPIYFYLYKYVPFFDKIRFPIKFLFLTTIAISITAGLGYDRLRDGINEKSPVVRRLVYGIFTFGLITAIVIGFLTLFESSISSLLKSKGLDTPNYTNLNINMHSMKRLLCITTIFGLVVFVGLKRHATSKFLSSVILVLLTIDLFFTGDGFYCKMPSETYHGISPNMSFIMSDKSLFRIFTTPKTCGIDSVGVVSSQSKRINIMLEKILPGLNIEKHIFSMFGWETLPPKRVHYLYSLIESAPRADSTNLLGLMNVKYVISVPEIESDELRLVRMNVPATTDKLDGLEKANTIKIYQNLNCLPRAFLVKDYKVLASEEEYKNIMKSKDFDPTKVLLLDEPPRNLDSPVILSDSEESHGNEKIIEKVEIVQYNNNSVHLQVNLPEPKFLFMSESYYPGWKAYVNGRKAHIYRANYAFRALFLEPGEHKVEFIYDPWTFKVGLIITAITICIIGFLLIRFKHIRMSSNTNLHQIRVFPKLGD